MNRVYSVRLCTSAARRSVCLLLLAALFLVPATVHAAGKAQAAREAAEYMIRTFSKEAGGEGVEKLATRLESVAVRHGDDALLAARKVGPRGLRVIEEAGEHAGTASGLLARHGDEALWIVEQPARLATVARHGDEAATALLKHKGVADDLITTFQKPAATALNAIDGPQAIRLAKLSASGELAAIGRTDELLGVIGRYGNRGLDFVWKHKGSLAVGTVLAAFLADPQPFIDGTRDLADVTLQHGAALVQPALEQMAEEAARQTNWTWLAIATVCVAGLCFAFRSYVRKPAAIPQK